MKPKTLLIVSGLLLILGLAVSWVTLPGNFISFSIRITALGTDELLLAAGGLLLLLIGIFSSGRPGKMFSDFGLIISILCGLISYKLLVATLPLEGGVTTWLDLGLSCLRPLGSWLGFLGSIMRTSTKPVVPVAPAEPVPTTYSEPVQPS